MGVPLSRTEKTLEIARKAFADIQARFPHLQATFREGGPVDLSVDMPVQSRLKYEVNLNLQGDELHFSVSHFWLEWFPCTKPAIVEAYITAVSGFLSGEYRIVEHYRGNNCVKAELQSPKDTDWKTIGVSSNNFWSLLPWPKKHLVVIRNA
jgi:hypothetical protein